MLSTISPAVLSAPPAVIVPVLAAVPTVMAKACRCGKCLAGAEAERLPGGDATICVAVLAGRTTTC